MWLSTWGEAQDVDSLRFSSRVCEKASDEFILCLLDAHCRLVNKRQGTNAEAGGDGRGGNGEAGDNAVMAVAGCGVLRRVLQQHLPVRQRCRAALQRVARVHAQPLEPAV